MTFFDPLLLGLAIALALIALVAALSAMAGNPTAINGVIGAGAMSVVALICARVARP